MEKRFQPNTLPRDSCLWDYLASQSITEVPPSYSLACGMSIFGCLLRRNIWIDQVNWKVWPNLSILLIGPSGIGKDVAINASREVLIHLEGFPHDTVIGGATSEAWKDQLLQLQNLYGAPTVALLPANELTAVIGSKDYQKSMVQELTDLLSTGSAVDISTKSGGRQVIYQPTLTVLSGSTAEWLQKAMPEGSMEGGLLPRFFVVVEHYTNRFIPLVKYQVPTRERNLAVAAGMEFQRKITELTIMFKEHPQELAIIPDAADMYTNWYYNRFNLFATSVQSYANRSRDQVLRLAMLCAASCGRNYISEEDMHFGISFMLFVGQRIEGVLKPPSKDKQVADELVEVLEQHGGTATSIELVRALLQRRSRRDIEDGMSALMSTARVARSKDGKSWILTV